MEKDEFVIGVLRTGPTTNADRIRAMSDEKLVELFHDQIGCGRSFIPCGVLCCNECDTLSSNECLSKIKKWLQQPAEGGEQDGAD